jgi:hypothetical protein
MLPAANKQGINQRGAKADLGCMPILNGVMITTTAAGTAPVAGGAFTLPGGVFKQAAPAKINAIGLTTPPGFVQFATGNVVSGPPTPRDEAPGGTLLTGCTGTGGAQMCANQAAPRAFKVGPRLNATGSGRAGFAFNWCPPVPPLTMGAPGCAAIGGGPGGAPGIVKYFGTAGAFGGTMGYITRAVIQGSLWRFGSTGKIQGTPFPLPGMNGSQPTGRGYADFNTDALYAAAMFSKFMVKSVPTTPGMYNHNPALGMQKLITSLGLNTGPAGLAAVAYNWGFPLTTKTVVARNTGTIAGNPHNTTLTGKGYDCVNKKGVGCAVTTGMGYRNINLVAGAIGVGVFSGLVVPTADFASVYMPEPGATLQLLAGALGMLGIAAWRSRRGH